jgi:hypothetical protein
MRRNESNPHAIWKLYLPLKAYRMTQGEIKDMNQQTDEHTTIEPGMRVYYLPDHAKGNLAHKDVEQGIVVRTNATYAFVLFDGHTTAQACHPKQLRRAASA